MEINEQNPGRKVSINLVKANIFALVIMAVSLVVLFVPFVYIWRGNMSIGGPQTWGIFLLATVLGIVVHELIHGLTWAIFAKRGWKSISFGIIWNYLTPYCHCDEPMRIRHYQAACLMPFLVLGVLPSIIALFFGSLPLLLWGIIFIAAAAGDIWIAWLLTKENPQSLVLDHPSEAGYYIMES